MLLTGVLLGVISCTGVPQKSATAPGAQGGAGDIRHRAERVFRRENQATDRAIFAQMDIGSRDPDAADRLYRAEDAVRKACEPLNQVAFMHVANEQPTLVQELSVPMSLTPCERETEKLETLLRSRGL